MLPIQNSTEKAKQELQYNDKLPDHDVWHFPPTAIIRVPVRLIQLGAAAQHILLYN